MPITQFTVGFSRTVNLGNYESCRIEASVTLALDPEGDDIAVLGSEAQVELRRLLEMTYKAQFQDRQKPG